MWKSDMEKHSMQEHLTIDSIIDVHKLLKQMGEKTTPQALAAECGVKKTEMMKFINDNIDHFQVTKWAHKNRFGKVDKEWLIVDAVYADPAYNPHSQQYVERRKKEHIIRLYKIDYYQHIYGCRLAEEPKAWENQEEDVAKFLAIPEVKDTVKFYFGGIMDSYEVEFKNAFRKEDAEAVFNEMVASGLVPNINGRNITTAEDLISE